MRIFFPAGAIAVAIAWGAPSHALTLDSKKITHGKIGSCLLGTGLQEDAGDRGNVGVASVRIAASGGSPYRQIGVTSANYSGTVTKQTAAGIANFINDNCGLTTGVAEKDVEVIDPGATPASSGGFGFFVKIGDQTAEASIGEPSFKLAADSDASLSASMGADATTISSTVDTAAEAVALLDFVLKDGGTSDAKSLSVSAVDVNVSGTGSGSASKLTWLLNGPDASNVQGVVSGGKVTFSGLNLEIADGDAAGETYTVKAYVNGGAILGHGSDGIVLSRAA